MRQKVIFSRLLRRLVYVLRGRRLASVGRSYFPYSLNLSLPGPSVESSLCHHHIVPGPVNAQDVDTGTRFDRYCDGRSVLPTLHDVRVVINKGRIVWSWVKTEVPDGTVSARRVVGRSIYCLSHMWKVSDWTWGPSHPSHQLPRLTELGPSGECRSSMDDSRATVDVTLGSNPPVDDDVPVTGREPRGPPPCLNLECPKWYPSSEKGLGQFLGVRGGCCL